MASIGALSVSSQLIGAMSNTQDIIFKKSGALCSCGTTKYLVLRDAIEIGELCPVCNGDIKIQDLIDAKLV